MESDRRNLIAQWAFDTRPILGRFHLWLEDVEERWIKGEDKPGFSFAGESLERCFVVSAAVTALGTFLFGRYGDAKGEEDKKLINRVKKDADAVSAYAMSESLWYLTRNLPENHAVMVSLGEGLMPKAGETPEMGSNPQLGFGRVYARAEIAKYLDRQVNRLINDPGFEWEEFWKLIRDRGMTIWGAAIDTLENTTRFAHGASTGPITVLHLFDQPLEISRPYEGYMGTLVLPEEVVRQAEERSILIDYLTPRETVLEAIRHTYPGIRDEHIHVWTLAGPSRVGRIGWLWDTWRKLGVHLVEEGWTLPTGMGAFTESGTYAPAFLVGTREDDEGNTHLFLVDGYAASAEAIQAASLDPVLGVETSMCIFSSRFKVSSDREQRIMRLDPEAEEFPGRLAETMGTELDDETVEDYREIIRQARDAGMPLHRRAVRVDEFFPRKRWRALAVIGYMLDDPYTGVQGVRRVDPNDPYTYRVTTRAATKEGCREVTLTLRLTEDLQESRLVFSPLLARFCAGTDHTTRPVKISDSGRIRNELQTIVSEALEHVGETGIRVHFDRIDTAVLPEKDKEKIREVLTWYKENHPIWFQWLELV
jgi:hypothetical protein